MERCGPDCTVVGIGRSPTPLTAFIETFEPGRTVNLPLSNFRHHIKPDVPMPRLRPGQKEILLLDISEVGASIFSAELHLKKFLKERNLNIEVRTFAFTKTFFRSQFNDMARTYCVQANFIWVLSPKRTEFATIYS